MAYPYTSYQAPYYQPYQPPMPDQLTQLRQAQIQAPAQAPMPQSMPTPQPQPTAPAASGGIIWVQGEEGAKAYMVASGNSVLLMDSENSAFYIKSTDASGMPMPLRVFDYEERTAAPRGAQAATQPLPDNLITRTEFEALAARLDALERKEASKPTKEVKEKKEGTKE